MSKSKKLQPRKANTAIKTATPVRAPKVREGGTNTFQPGFWRENWLAALILMAGAFALYAYSISFKYMLDDQMVIWENAYVQKGFGGLREIFSGDSFMGYFKKQQNLLEGGRYRPLSLATFAAEIGILGKGHTMLPHVSHFINILLYGLTGVILYRILLGVFPLKSGGKWYFGIPFLASILFIVHPLHSECIANIKGRDEILALLLSLFALYANLKYFDKRNALWLVISGLCMLLGMLSKESALTFVAVIPLTTWFFARISAGSAIKAAIPLMLAGIVFIMIRFNALGYVFGHGKAVDDLMNNPFLEMTGSEKMATIFMTLGWYIKLLFWPQPLTHDYYPYHVPKVGWSDWRAIASFVLYAGMGVWALLNLKKRKLAAYAIVFWVLTLSIVSNLFVPVGTFMNERFVYMPSVAFCILIGWFFARILPQLFKTAQDNPGIFATPVFVGLIALFGYFTMQRVPVWKDEMALNRAAIKVSYKSARSHCFFVTSLYKGAYQVEKDPQKKELIVDTMEYHINESLRINPNYGSAFIMKAAVAGARFEQDKQLDKLFHEFTYIIENIPYNNNFRSYLDSYMKYLDGSNSDKYVPFCYRIGYEYYYKKMNDAKTGLHFLQFGLDRQTEDIRTLESMGEIYQAIGEGEKAASFKARADAQR